METLLKDYKRKLETITELIKRTRSNGSIVHQRREERLNTKASEYRTFIAELTKITQPSKNNDLLGIADVRLSLHLAKHLHEYLLLLRQALYTNGETNIKATRKLTGYQTPMVEFEKLLGNEA